MRACQRSSTLLLVNTRSEVGEKAADAGHGRHCHRTRAEDAPHDCSDTCVVERHSLIRHTRAAEARHGGRKEEELSRSTSLFVRDAAVFAVCNVAVAAPAIVQTDLLLALLASVAHVRGRAGIVTKLSRVRPLVLMRVHGTHDLAERTQCTHDGRQNANP